MKTYEYGSLVKKELSPGRKLAIIAIEVAQ
jgi:hypothetical protein